MVQNKPISGLNPDDPKHLRLTLRTLLAYLDDVLEPSQAREIGTKIQETQYASQLVDRIQDVLRRRRVAAPDLTGPGAGLDPNTVAEYLDNTLPAQSVPDVERVCLESDTHLAEVAACHQILTLVLGDPLHVSAESRERLHALIPAALAHQPAAARALSPSARGSAAAAHQAPAQAASQQRAAREPMHPSANGGAASAARFSETIPEYLKPRALWKRALVPALVVLVLMLWLVLLIYDPSLIGGSKQTDELAQNAPPIPAKTEPQTTPANTQAEDASEPKSETSPEKIPPKPEPVDSQPDQAIVIDPQPPQDKQPANAVVANKAPANASESKPPNASKNTLPPEPATAEQATSKTEPQTPPAAAAPEIIYTTKAANTATNGMLLRYNAGEQEWGTLPYRSRVIVGEQLACPEPLDAVFSISNTDCEVAFIGGVLASFQPAQPPSAFALNLSQGKVLFTRGEGGDDSVPLTVKVGEDVLQLELLEPQTRCGLEILPRLPKQPEQSLGPNWYIGRLFVDSGQVRFLDRTGKTYELAGKQALDVSPNEVAEGEPEMPAKVEVDQIMPEWLNPLTRGFTSQTAKYMRQIHSAFQEADVESDVTTVLLPLAKNDKTPPAVAVMAAKTLAMTGCLRDVADLLSLNEASPEELRMATIEGIRRWLTLHPDKEHGERLRDELLRNFRRETANRIYRLLWGYRKSDLMDTARALELVDYLMDDNITVRTLAFVHLHELTNRINNYRPLDSESQRKTAVTRWRNDVLEDRLFN